MCWILFFAMSVNFTKMVGFQIFLLVFVAPKSFDWMFTSGSGIFQFLRLVKTYYLKRMQFLIFIRSLIRATDTGPSIRLNVHRIIILIIFFFMKAWLNPNLFPFWIILWIILLIYTCLSDYMFDLIIWSVTITILFFGSYCWYIHVWLSDYMFDYLAIAK